MRTTLNINPDTLRKVVDATGEKNKSRAVDRALEEYLRREAIERLLAARGKFPQLVDRTAEWEEEELKLERVELERGPVGTD